MRELTSTQKQMNKPVDVSFGLPLYMQPYWDFIYKAYPAKTTIKINDNLPYNFGNGKPDLIAEIIRLHKYVGNAETRGYTVVVGSGASQVVSALGYAAAKLNFRQTLLRPPYWGRLKTLLNVGSNMAGQYGDSVKHTEADITAPHEKVMTFTVNPNNPDGFISLPDPQFEVVDMCYNWPQYMDNVYKGKHHVMIFGLSKATGHAGTRIGWALVKDPIVAQYMKEFIETSTCGASSDAQSSAYTIIKTTMVTKHMEIPDCFSYAKEKLKERWSKFRAVVELPEKDFFILNRSGMFAWCAYKAKKHETLNFADIKAVMEEKYGIEVNPGYNLGLDFNTPCFRINLGCADETFEQLLKVLQDGNKIKKS